MKKLLALCIVSLLSLTACSNYSASGFNLQKGLVADGETARYNAVEINDLQSDIIRANCEDLNSDWYEIWFFDRTSGLTDAIRPR